MPELVEDRERLKLHFEALKKWALPEAHQRCLLCKQNPCPLEDLGCSEDSQVFLCWVLDGGVGPVRR